MQLHSIIKSSDNGTTTRKWPALRDVLARCRQALWEHHFKLRENDGLAALNTRLQHDIGNTDMMSVCSELNTRSDAGDRAFAMSLLRNP